MMTRPTRSHDRLVRMAALLLATVLAGCSGPFFYHDVIVPTYRQVDPNTGRLVQAPVQP